MQRALTLLIASAQVSSEAQTRQACVVGAQERVNGSNRFFVWVEDVQSRELAGGEAPAGG